MANQYPNQRPFTAKHISGGQLVDVSAPSISYVAVPERGKIKTAYACISAAVTGADTIVTVKKKTGNTSTVTLGTITIAQSGSYVGQVFEMVITATALSSLFVEENDTLIFDSDGASSTTSIANFSAVLLTAPAA
jgi:hypothetical protein